MTEQKAKGPTPEDMALLKLAQDRLAVQLGGRWATQAAQRAADTTPEEMPEPIVEITSRAELVAEQSRNIQTLQSLGLLAADSTKDRSPYFVQ